jgi:hypothetical protein
LAGYAEVDAVSSGLASVTPILLPQPARVVVYYQDGSNKEFTSILLLLKLSYHGNTSFSHSFYFILFYCKVHADVGLFCKCGRE